MAITLSPARPLKRSVLVTGASGFLGRHCLQPLSDLGFEVHATARTPENSPGVMWHGADLLDPKVRLRLIKTIRPLYLLHLAWYLEPGKYAESPINLDWLAASIDLARLFREAGGQKLVVTGSCFEYDWSTPRLAEVTPLRPRTMYGHAKRLLFEALSVWAERDGPDFAWARLFFLYGPGEDQRRLAADIARSLLLGKEVDTSEGRQRRDYMYVEDAGRALAALLDSNVSGPINIATGTAIPVAELVGAIADRIGRRELVRFGARPSPAADPDCLEADTTILRNALGWHNFTPMADAVDRTVKWWQSQLSAEKM